MTIDLDRRALVQTGTALAAGAALATAGTPAAAQAPSPAATGPNRVIFDVKPMPFDPEKIKDCRKRSSPATTPTITPAQSNGSIKSPSNLPGSITPKRPDS